MSKSKTAFLIALFLILTIAFSLIALPIANGQISLTMNLPGDEGQPHYVLIHAENYDIDLNGPSSFIANVTLWVKYPGRTDFTYINGYPTQGSGDLDVYDFDFNETGDFELKWVVFEPSYAESNVEIARVVASLPPEYIASFVYVGASPNPVGVNQAVVIVTWTADLPPDIGEEYGLVDSPTGRAGWYDVSVTITKPDETNETLQFGYSDPVGANWLSYTPSDVGTYVLQANFPGAWKNSSAGNIYYEPDVSDPIELTVQEEQISGWQEPPLPTGYWTRPLNTANREWYILAGNWLGGDANTWPIGSGSSAAGGFGVPSSDSRTENFAYGFGTETPHILWTKQYYTGGLMDYRYGDTGYATAHYQGLGFSGIALQGQLHYSPRITHAGTQGWAIVDLYTGEELFLDYEQNRPSFGSIYDYESPNQHGGFAYLWRTSGVTLPDRVNVAHAKYDEGGNVRRTAPATTIDSSEVRRGTTWEMIDGFTGQTICYIANVSTAGEGVYGKDGSITYYNIANLGGANYLQVWNSSAGTMIISSTGTGAWQYRPAGGGFGGANPFFGSTSYNNVHDGRLFYSLNVSIPSIEGPVNSRLNETGNILSVREGDSVIIGTSGVNDEQGIAPGWMMAISLEEGKEGTKLWEGTWTPPSTAGRTQAPTFGQSLSGFVGVYPEYGIFMYRHQRTNKRFAFSLENFQLVWESEPEVQFGYYGSSENVYNGILYSYGYGGVIYAYNITTGDVLWTYEATSEGFESAYGGNYPIGVVIISQDGKLYTVTGEHSPTQPLYRGHNLRCINATTGDEIWKIQGWFGGMSPTSSNILMADGILVGLNFFDNQLYAFGKGPSATTVSAPQINQILGSSVTIVGTITDQTPTGRRNSNDVFEFSLKGTPAISDEDMSAWIEYMFMQQAKPTDAKGVEVVLETLDPNGNFYEIGRATSDIAGNFGLKFTPEVPGQYQIIARFDGSAAYGPSYATTYLNVEEAPQASPTPTPPPPAMTDTYVIGFGTAMIIMIAVIGALVLLRKR